jgi:hypothetical protein
MELTRGETRENHVVEFEEGRRIAWRPAEPGQRPPGHLWRWELEPTGPAGTRVTHTYDWTELTDDKRLPRARATTAVKLRASLDRLAALAEGAPSAGLAIRVRRQGVAAPDREVQVGALGADVTVDERRFQHGAGAGSSKVCSSTAAAFSYRLIWTAARPRPSVAPVRTCTPGVWASTLYRAARRPGPTSGFHSMVVAWSKT